ncbi:MAG: PIN domain-containing protein [Myxococcaceae bacterium]
MIGLDTNVLVRYIVRDDARQTAAATRLIEARCNAKDPARITLVVLCELVWVLARGYGHERPAIANLLRRLLAAEDLQVERSELAWQALNLYAEGKADFSDYVIGFCNRDDKADTTYTFDKRTRGCDLFEVLGS